MDIHGWQLWILAAIIAGSLLFALAWSTFVLGRARDLG